MGRTASMPPAPGAVSTGKPPAPKPADTPATLAMTCAQNRTGSLSPGSTDTHAVRDAVSARRQSRSRQVFPPARRRADDHQPGRPTLAEATEEGLADHGPGTPGRQAQLRGEHERRVARTTRTS